ncbi:MAG: beta-ketoacyl synthase N-terminal-like domain-containing protein, partial [bacterium]|nr:beta-ketoacyl synthase N-terminal-like domain-containing protein [bacterium]
MRRVVITGYGLVSALGNDVTSAYERLKVLKNTVQVSNDLASYVGLQSHLCSLADGFVPPAHYTRKVTRTMGRVSILSLAATEQALAQAGLLNDPMLKQGRTGIAYGSSSGSVDAIAAFYTVIAAHEVKNVTSSTY